jgi:uncharacterized coiled-coil protein SlyX
MSGNRIHAVEQACAELAAAGDPVTFVTVASRSGVPRVTLYRNPALRAIVEEHRARAHDASTLTGLAAQLASQQLALEALAAKVRRHEELLRKLGPPR